MAATITSFLSALHTPSNFLRTLFSAKIEKGQIVRRTTEFAEVIISWQQQRYLLSLPLTAQALRTATRSAVTLRALRSARILEYRVLPNEMEYLDSRGQLCHCDLVLQQIPSGSPLSDQIEEVDPQQLLSSLNQAEAELRRLSLSLGNLKAENIILTPQLELYPIRLHYAAIDAEASHSEFSALREYISATLGVDAQQYNPSQITSEPLNALYGYKSVGNPFEGMCVAESTQGYGYISGEGEEIIRPQYLWAGDMREGRAEVETESGMGLIDAQGNYIIEPKYQIVEFDPRTGRSRVKLDEEWRWLDYEGREVSDVSEVGDVGDCPARTAAGCSPRS